MSLIRIFFRKRIMAVSQPACGPTGAEYGYDCVNSKGWALIRRIPKMNGVPSRPLPRRERAIASGSDSIRGAAFMNCVLMGT